MRRFSALLLVTAPLLAPPREAQAQGAAFLSVTREAGAESCPDTAALLAHVERVRGHRTTGETGAYHVHFSHHGGAFRATIRVGESSGTRELRDRGASCASLEQAVAVTLALLLDSDALESSSPPPTPPAPPPPAPLPERAPAPPPEPERVRRAVSLSLSLGAGGLFGVVQPIAPVALAELGIGVERFRTSIGVMWMPAQRLDFGPGSLNETLIGGVARTCLTAWRGAPLRFDLCSGVYAGVLKVEARGYTRDDAVEETWLAVPLGVALTGGSPALGIELGGSALLPLRHHDFAIDNLGVAYRSWPVGVLLSLRAVGSLVL